MITPPATSLAFPDLSAWQKGLTLVPGTPAVFAKATESTTYNDGAYIDFRRQAEAIGALFSAYHYLSAGDGAGQADFCLAMVGARPTMLDVERTNHGVAPSIADALQFCDRFRAKGGRVWALYLPKWRWQELGEPDLTPFAKRGLILVSSDYSGDENAGWSSYGGMTPAIRQFTNAYEYGGRYVDFNEFRGTKTDLATLMYGEDTDMTSAQDVWSYKGDDAGDGGPDTPDVHQSLLTTRDDVAEIKQAVATLAARVEQVAAKVGA